MQTTMWTGPAGLLLTCYKVLVIMKQVTGAVVKPIQPRYLLNKDMYSSE